MTAFMLKISDRLLLTESLRQTHLQCERYQVCSDKVYGLVCYCGVKTRIMRASQACTFGYGAFTLDADCFKCFLKAVRLRSIRVSGRQSIVSENTNGTGS